MISFNILLQVVLEKRPLNKCSSHYNNPASHCKKKLLRTAKCFKFKDILKDKCKLLDASSVTKMKNNHFNMDLLVLLQTAMTDQARKDRVDTP